MSDTAINDDMDPDLDGVPVSEDAEPQDADTGHAASLDEVEAEDE